METKLFLSLLDERIHQYNLLTHPFYKAWSAGELTNEDLRAYAEEYYPHVEAFPSYLAQLGVRLEEGELRRAVLANMTDEKGGEDSFGEPERSHAEMWLDFVEGVGGNRIPRRQPSAEVRKLIASFHRVASEGTPEEALASFYAYESQVPSVAAEKERVLRELYAANESTRSYFTLHATADVYHANVWRSQLEKRVKDNPKAAERLSPLPNLPRGPCGKFWMASSRAASSRPRLWRSRQPIFDRNGTTYSNWRARRGRGNR